MQKGPLSFEKEMTFIAQQLQRIYPSKMLFSYNGICQVLILIARGVGVITARADI
jgi:hypothetical protein